MIKSGINTTMLFNNYTLLFINNTLLINNNVFLWSLILVQTPSPRRNSESKTEILALFLK